MILTIEEMKRNFGGEIGGEMVILNIKRRLSRPLRKDTMVNTWANPSCNDIWSTMFRKKQVPSNFHHKVILEFHPLIISRKFLANWYYLRHVLYLRMGS